MITAFKRTLQVSAVLAGLIVAWGMMQGLGLKMAGQPSCPRTLFDIPGLITVTIRSLDRALVILVVSLIAGILLQRQAASTSSGTAPVAPPTGRTAGPGGRAGVMAYHCFRILGLRLPGTDLEWNGGRIALWMAALLFLVLTALPAYRYLNCGTIMDLDIFAESLENAIRGRAMVSSAHVVQYFLPHETAALDTTTLHLFVDHYNPVLYLLVPVYWLFPSPITLFAVQALLVASGVWALFRIAKQELGNEAWAVLVALLYCLYPSVIATSWHFLPCVFPIPLLVWAFWARSTGRDGLMLACLLLSLASWEVAAVPVMSFGAYLLLYDRKRYLGLGVIVAAALWLVICMRWVIPSYAPWGASFQTVYSAFGDSLFHAVRNVLLHPLLAIPYLVSAQTIAYVVGLLLPLAFLPLLRWDVWLLALPILLQNIFAGDLEMMTWYRWPGGHWSAGICAFSFMAAIYALKTVENSRGKRAVRNVLLVAVAASAVTLPSVWLHPRTVWSDPLMKTAVHEVQKRVPPGVRLSTDCPSLLLWEYGRYRVSLFPAGLEHADYVFVTMAADTWPRPPADQMQYYDLLEDDARFAEIWSIEGAAPGPGNPDQRKLALFQRIADRPGENARPALSMSHDNDPALHNHSRL